MERRLLDRLVQALEEREPVALVTVTAAEGEWAALLGRQALVWADERPLLGDLGLLTEPGAAIARQALARREHQQQRILVDTGAATIFVEVEVPPPLLIIVGAGHIAVPLAAMARLCDFDVTVMDDRPQFANRERFPTADRIVVGPLRQELRKLRGARPVFGGETYVVLVTRGHQYDVECLLEVLDDPVAYIGMIGSRRRVRAVYDLLASEQGIPREQFDRIHAPIGLDIGARTPAEIAVCILAEMIGVMRGREEKIDAEAQRRRGAQRNAG
jgi:xanthine dehydrogenase accessory factor